MTDFLSEAASLQSFLQAVRQTLHRAPELGNQEFKTSAYLRSILEPLGLTVENPFGTALCATLHGARPRQNRRPARRYGRARRHRSDRRGIFLPDTRRHARLRA